MDEWIRIPVPALVSEQLFATVQDQLDENRTRARHGQRGVRWVLQGLLCCAQCGYSYCGRACRCHGQVLDYGYYRCTGNDLHRDEGITVCTNKPVRTDRVEAAVWREVRVLLGRLDDFAQTVRDNLDQVDRTTKQTIIRTLVKRVEIDLEEIRVIFRVGPEPPDRGRRTAVSQDCSRCLQANFWWRRRDRTSDARRMSSWLSGPPPFAAHRPWPVFGGCKPKSDGDWT
jgi:site-specific DNA recombinase